MLDPEKLKGWSELVADYETMKQRWLESMSPEERLRGLAPEDRLHGLAPEDRLRGLSPEEQERLLQILLRQHN